MLLPEINSQRENEFINYYNPDRYEENINH